MNCTGGGAEVTRETAITADHLDLVASGQFPRDPEELVGTDRASRCAWTRDSASAMQPSKISTS